MLIEDQGGGFDSNTSTPGNGLRNMADRAHEIGADYQFDAQNGRGRANPSASACRPLCFMPIELHGPLRAVTINARGILMLMAKPKTDRKIRLYLVDDHRVVRAGIRSILRGLSPDAGDGRGGGRHHSPAGGS